MILAYHIVDIGSHLRIDLLLIRLLEIPLIPPRLNSASICLPTIALCIVVRTIDRDFTCVTWCF